MYKRLNVNLTVVVCIVCFVCITGGHVASVSLVYNKLATTYLSPTDIKVPAKGQAQVSYIHVYTCKRLNVNLTVVVCIVCRACITGGHVASAFLVCNKLATTYSSPADIKTPAKRQAQTLLYVCIIIEYIIIIIVVI